MINIKEYINFLVNNQINQRQFLVLYLFYFKDLTLLNTFKNNFKIEENKVLSKEDLDDLLTKEFLIKLKGGYKLGEKFLNIFVTPVICTDEVYSAYPAFMQSEKGTNIPLINMDRQIFEKIYIGKINGSLLEHKEILKDIQYGVKNNLITLGINKFLTSEYWKVLRKLRLTRPTSNHLQDDKTF